MIQRQEAILSKRHGGGDIVLLSQALQDWVGKEIDTALLKAEFKINRAVEKLETRVEDNLQQIYSELQSLIVLLEKANKGELPPNLELAEVIARLQTLETTVAGIQVRIS